jgi:hypothetical protein
LIQFVLSFFERTIDYGQTRRKRIERLSNLSHGLNHN